VVENWRDGESWALDAESGELFGSFVVLQYSIFPIFQYSILSRPLADLQFEQTGSARYSTNIPEGNE